MSIDEIEKLARSFVAEQDRHDAFCKMMGKPVIELSVERFARFILAVLPVVMAANAWRAHPYQNDNNSDSCDRLLITAIDTLHSHLGNPGGGERGSDDEA